MNVQCISRDHQPLALSKFIRFRFVLKSRGYHKINKHTKSDSETDVAIDERTHTRFN